MDYFRAYLEQGTVFAAMVRGAEGLLMERAGPCAPPVLDIGCGDGFFASLLGPPGGFLGVDSDAAVLHLAARSGAYAAVAAASATALPFTTAAFATVMANSSLEHIPDLDAALDEIARVLLPGGQLLVTAPSDRFAALLAGSRLFGAAYGRWFNRHSRHFHTDSAAVWERRLAARGLDVVRSHAYFPAPAMLAFDLAHYLSVPRLVARALCGKWVAVPSLTLNRLYERAWRRHADPSPVAEGAYVFIEARKRS
jgi:SAM-dependent methyltransferase